MSRSPERDLGVEQLLEQSRAGAARGTRRDGGSRRSPAPRARGCARRSRARCASAPAARPPRGGRPSRCLPSFPSWPRGTGLKDRGNVSGRCDAARGRGRAVLAVGRGGARRCALAPGCDRARAPGARTSARASRPPRSGNGTSIVSKSRGASVAANTARASLAQLAAGIAAGDVREREQPDLGVARELGRLARRCCASVSRARSASSSAKVASCTSTSASCAAIASASHGAVSPEITTLRPSRGGPITCSGATPATVSPRCRRPKSGPGSTPSSLGQPRVEMRRAAGSSTSA